MSRRSPEGVIRMPDRRSQTVVPRGGTAPSGCLLQANEDDRAHHHDHSISGNVKLVTPPPATSQCLRSLRSRPITRCAATSQIRCKWATQMRNKELIQQTTTMLVRWIPKPEP